MPDPAGRSGEDDLFDERNAFLDLLLGMISMSERTLAALAELADPAPPPGVEPRRASAPDGPILR